MLNHQTALKFITNLLFIISLTSLCAQGEEVLVDKIVAKVNDKIVLKSELEIGILQMKQNEPYNFSETDLGCAVLEQLVVNKVLLAKADIDSVTIDEKRVEAQLDRRMQYFQAQFGSEAAIEETYGKSIDDLKNELRDQLKDQMLAQKMQEQITAAIKVTPAEVKKFYNSIPKDSLPFFSAEYEVGQIVKEAVVSKKEKQSVIDQLVSLRNRVQQGESFEELAKMYSQDPGSARLGGSLGFRKKGELVAPYEAAALDLEPGELSMPVESQFGFHLIQLIERRGSEYKTRHILLKTGGTQTDLSTTFDQLDSIKTLILNDSLSFSQAAKKFSEDKETASNGGLFFNPNTNDTRIDAESMDPVLFFMIDTMEVGQISNPMEFTTRSGKKAGRIIYYKSKKAPHQANLRDDYQKIYNATTQEKKNTAINEWFDDARKEVYISIVDEYKDCKLLENTEK